MTWQVNWRRWQWPWRDSHYDGICGWTDIYSHYAGIGPFQFHWYSSKPYNP